MLTALRETAQRIKVELDIYRDLVADPRTPWLARVLLGAAIGYLFLPFDLIPDAIPVLGQLDDLVIVPGLVILAIRVIPAELVQEVRSRHTPQ